MGVYFSIPSPPTSPSSSSSATSPPVPPPLPPGTCSSFTDLPAFADALITQHLSPKERAPFSTATKRCRIMYLRHISVLRISGEPLMEVMTKENQASKQPLECDIDYQAQVLANSLKEMPHLSRLVLETNKWHWLLHQVIGKALLLLPGPLKVEKIERLGNAPAPIPPGLTSPLAVAIAEGRLPFLESMDICDDDEGTDSFWRSQNLECLGKAITLGYLSQLTTLQLEGGEAVGIVEKSFRDRLSQEQQGSGANGSRPFQANIQSFTVTLPDEVVVRWGPFVAISWGRLSELLSLPIFGHLQDLSLNCNITGSNAQVFISEELSLLTAYIQHTGGAPCLKELQIVVSYYFRDCSMGPLVEVLENGGVPNLESLSGNRFESHTLQELGRIYRAGRFVNLKKMELGCPHLDEEGVRFWMEGVLASGHKGTALQKLVVKDPNWFLREGDETDGHEASIVFIDLLSRGVFPNLECLEVQNDWGEFLHGDEMLGRFIHAMRDGAPCAKTLRTLELSFDVVSPEIMNELQLLLPQVELRSYTAQPFFPGMWPV